MFQNTNISVFGHVRILVRAVGGALRTHCMHPYLRVRFIMC